MSRSRNIKPAFFSNDDLSECEVLARLLFISLWCQSDRDGRLRYRPKKIKAEALPYDDCDIKDLLGQLLKYGFIFVYSVDNTEYLQINNWSKHQNPHHKEVESDIPIYDSSIHDLSISHAQVMHEPSAVCEGYIPLSKTISQRILDRDGGNCSYCESTTNLEIDHIIPVTKGGNSVDDNLQVLCKSCNILKFNHIVDQESSVKHGRVMLESCIDHAPIIENASCPTDSLSLIPDSLNLIPDSGLLIPSKTLVELKLNEPDDAEQVFKFWKTTLNHPKSAYDSKRKALIKKSLKNYQKEDLMKAIHGCSVTPFNMGENDSGAVFDKLSLIFKDSDQIDRFITNSDNPPTGPNKTIEQFQNDNSKRADRIMESMGMNANG